MVRNRENLLNFSLESHHYALVLCAASMVPLVRSQCHDFFDFPLRGWGSCQHCTWISIHRGKNKEICNNILLYLYRGPGLYDVKGSVLVLFQKLHQRGARKGRVCKIQNIAYASFDIIIAWSPVLFLGVVDSHSFDK